MAPSINAVPLDEFDVRLYELFISVRTTGKYYHRGGIKFFTANIATIYIHVAQFNVNKKKAPVHEMKPYFVVPIPVHHQLLNFMNY